MRIGTILAVLAIAAGPACGAWDRTSPLRTNATPSVALATFRLVDGGVVGVPVAMRTVPVLGDASAFPAFGAESHGMAIAGAVGDVPPAVGGGAAIVGAVGDIQPMFVGGTVAGAVDDVLPVVGGGMLGLRDLPDAMALAECDANVFFDRMPAYAVLDAGAALSRDVFDFGRLAASTGVETNRATVFPPVVSVANSEVDPLISLLDVWDKGPLGEMQRAANLARSLGDEAAFGNAAEDYWRAMNAAMERRTFFGGRGKRNRVRDWK